MQPDTGPFPEQYVAGWVERLRTAIPGAVAILAKGSVARGDATRWSDLDLDVLTDRPEDHRYPVFLEDEGGRLRHVSVAVHGAERWLERMAEPAHWAFGLAARQATRLLWCPDQGLAEPLDRPAFDQPPDDPEVEDTIEALGKMRGAHAACDPVGLRLAARTLAEGCPGLLLPINPPVRPGTRRAALEAACAFPVAPTGYRDDLLACLGLSPDTHPDEALLAAGERLVLGILDLMADHADAYEGLIAADLLGYVRDGAWRRLVTQG
ncbi:MAG TPA: nucleotidyltransferase domain-containing protein [Thermomicrobiales bacterium]|jgi:hypothetical protein|nr:nucleotidyltransferase domain-containing protein [Thermomicrobiales bacterium]